ncbi:exo-beta-N-acetylmuramidase NamZ family protein [Sediminibacterium ginsengisoli]|uniref:Uncharacterized conserved protein YbbC, DUF1343 family n=1 Tax=Sediminibacterium ginsengisoli TaxID=413434 RepID=A0A1T4NW85_9BACT|nr:DUF1343 domain-containing protein [Sediminibacterium ginsengisoli]SJZ83491.1 Uncharacterized conserved protein YbbC, DUF1343 family [Sediminibacterium ginsengisoli]
MISFGVDILLKANPDWRDNSIGLVTNHAATTGKLVPSRKALVENGFRITRLFSPEHGLSVTGADGLAMHDGTDPLTGLPVTSLYGDKLAPDEKDLADIDMLLFDIPDIGSRFYTYLWTMTYVLESAARYKKPLIILDRPNPVSGNLALAEGPLLREESASFIGRWPLPVRHSCTLGELAQYFNTTRGINADLQVYKCEGWDRGMFQPDWGVPFVATSPAIRNFESMLLYPGLCLLEATNISEGRSTPYAFTVAGAPWINSNELSGILNSMFSEEVETQAITFTPSEGKYAGQLCHGIVYKVNEIFDFQSVMNGLLLIKVIRSLYPAHFAWGTYPTHVNPSGINHLDKLLGINEIEALFELPLNSFMATFTREIRVKDWQEDVAPFLLY